MVAHTVTMKALLGTLVLSTLTFAQSSSSAAAVAVAAAPVAPGGILAWLAANWVTLAASLLLIDQGLIGIFPKQAIFGHISDVLSKIIPAKKQ